MFLAEPSWEHRCALSARAGAMGTRPTAAPACCLCMCAGLGRTSAACATAGSWSLWSCRDATAAMGGQGSAAHPAAPGPHSPSTRDHQHHCKGSCMSCEPSQGTTHCTSHLPKQPKPLPAPGSPQPLAAPAATSAAGSGIAFLR